MCKCFLKTSIKPKKIIVQSNFSIKSLFGGYCKKSKIYFEFVIYGFRYKFHFIYSLSQLLNTKKVFAEFPKNNHKNETLV
ncbi:hypothetical protein LEP1GSC151_4499 [Leptospira interrogans serovar Grippotyphosa str. LT2186]|uniref:Uncharacterized protein n=2 Tax=Leptospira interrogans TaxID=173 RepID=M3FPN6_LEPIR|nr:hypothetical protein LEP1GSC009_3011 [Leptospira interrogans serovar Grippotyphosa str. Andaman]EKR47170.1 hypothetical protein LEP1GSC097_4243 [Leptospira interrogans serovar Grippotyphosa str. UI 08368]EMF72155.1 hypothetical protein LEP1GSC148_3170 [Leptospira interrogans serovar Canicola str. LT1962]EMG09419.1 hypothetical protein LEP1GSC151_4499 [Leptospira interrogans serovar Grippotyphosa str. LT2186]EMG22745.1 hypothetical protein LEP1GSC150_4856 [Leptospira interrogans serovar Copen